MPRGRPKNLENRTAHEEIVLFLQWAEQHELDNIPVVAALGTAPTAQRIHDRSSGPISGVFRIAAALRERALPGH
jgi:hypothetical protein